MKNFIILLTCLLALSACKHTGSSTSQLIGQAPTDSGFKPAIVLSDSGWISLFDGASVSQWHTFGKKTVGKAWNVDSMSIHLQPGVRDRYQTVGGGDLVSNDTFSNFDLKLEWKIGKKANSGLMIYVQDDSSKYKETWNTGPEIQVCDRDSNEDAHSFKHEAGDIYDLIPSRMRAANAAMEWNHVEIVSNHGRLDVYLNDVHTISTTLWDDKWKALIAASKFHTMPGFGMFQSGRFALQDHGEEVWYRNIRVKKF